MADTKISALPASTTPLAGTEVLPIVQGGTTKNVSVSNLTSGRSVSATTLTLSTGSLVPSTAGQGVNFTANTPAAGMTSQLLNWYEEGTWTPSLGGSATYFFQTGSYTRVGRQVTVTGFLYVNAIGTGSTTTISGLPFTSQNTYQKGTVSFGELSNLAGLVSSVQGHVNSNATTIIIYNIAAAASANSVSAVFGNQTVMEFTATYFV